MHQRLDDKASKERLHQHDTGRHDDKRGAAASSTRRQGKGCCAFAASQAALATAWAGACSRGTIICSGQLYTVHHLMVHHYMQWTI